MKIERVAVIGAGVMGHGIAQVTAEAGYEVILIDTSLEIIARAAREMEESIRRRGYRKYKDEQAAKDFIDRTIRNFRISAEMSLSVAKVDLVIEAVTENLELKQQIFKKCDQKAPPHAIFASNTSSFLIKDISALCSAERKSKFGGLHFFNPVKAMKLLEVVRPDGVTLDTFNSLMEFGRSIGKVVVPCKEPGRVQCVDTEVSLTAGPIYRPILLVMDSPGFIVNRLGIPNLAEALSLVERGIATPEDVDKAVRLGLGNPTGPFETADVVGLDTLKMITETWHRRFPGSTSFTKSTLLNKLVSEGKLGRKSGEGFYKYEKSKL